MKKKIGLLIYHDNPKITQRLYPVILSEYCIYSYNDF